MRDTPGFPSLPELSPPLPPGRHGLSPEYVSAHQRSRLLRAVCEVCASRGYPHATIAHIARAAGVSLRTFYRHFPSKEECFLAAFSLALREVEATLTVAISEAEGPWPRQTRAALSALLGELSAHPSLARTLFVDVLFAGPPALRARHQALHRVHSLLPIPLNAPPEASEAAVGGVVETLYHATLDSRTQELPEMCEELTYCLLVPLIGHHAALFASSSSSGGG